MLKTCSSRRAYHSLERSDDEVQKSWVDAFEALLDDVIPILIHHTLHHVAIQFTDNPNLLGSKTISV